MPDRQCPNCGKIAAHQIECERCGCDLDRMMGPVVLVPAVEERHE